MTMVMREALLRNATLYINTRINYRRYQGGKNAQYALSGVHESGPFMDQLQSWHD